jgi:hypothetical protein
MKYIDSQMTPPTDKQSLISASQRARIAFDEEEERIASTPPHPWLYKGQPVDTTSARWNDAENGDSDCY